MKDKQIEFWQNKLSTGSFNASKDLNPELRILYMNYYSIYISPTLYANVLRKSDEEM